MFLAFWICSRESRSSIYFVQIGSNERANAEISVFSSLTPTRHILCTQQFLKDINLVALYAYYLLLKYKLM